LNLRSKRLALKRMLEQNGFLSVLYNLPRLAKGYQPIFLDYPVRPVPRYGYSLEPHPELSRLFSENEGAYVQTLRGFLALREGLMRIPLHQDGPASEPCWINNWLEGLDTFALYGFVSSRNAAVHLEIGSGYSTKVVRRAIRDHQLRTRLVSIDPKPRAEIDTLCDEVVRKPLEDCDVNAIVNELKPGDTFFFDGSHRSFMNSDVTVLFLEILPRLKPGVLVHIHDIYLPMDYMPDRAHWFYSEQYLLAASLLAGHVGYEVLLPNNYISNTPRIACALDTFWQEPRLAGVPRQGCSFWIQTR